MKKKIAIGLAIILTLSMTGSVIAFGADDVGVYDKNSVNGYTLSVIGIDGYKVSPSTGIVGTEEKARHVFEGVEKFKLEFNGQEDNQYLYFLIEPGDTNVPTSSNIAYINQNSGESSDIELEIYPSSLDKSGEYHICVSSSTEAYQEVASFYVALSDGWVYPEGVLLGDAIEDGGVDVTDSLAILQYRAGLITDKDINLTNADVDGNNIANLDDALKILQFRAGMIDSF